MNMIFFYSANHSAGNEQDYAWVKQGMIFPFIDNIDRCVMFCTFFFVRYLLVYVFIWLV